MKDTLFSLLSELFEQHLEDNAPDHPSFEQLIEHLERHGVEVKMLLEDGVGRPSRTALRVYTPEEIQKLNRDCRSFLLFLEQADVIAPGAREHIIHEAMQSEEPYIELHDLKIIILELLSDETEHPLFSAWLEYLLFRDQQETLLH